jgi:integrase
MSIYLRGVNWYIDFTFKGQRIRESIGPSRKGAEKVIAKRKTEIAENKFLDKRKDPSPINFHDFAKEYVQWTRANKKPSTLHREISTMRRLDREFGDKAIQEITTWQIEKWKSRRKEAIRKPDAAISSLTKKKRDGTETEIWCVEFPSTRGRGARRKFDTKQEAEAHLKRIQNPIQPATVNRELSLLKHMFSKAVEWSKVRDNPTRRVKLLKGEVQRVRFLMPDEIQMLLSNCPDHIKPIVTLAVHTGMRKGELLGLKWDQVSFEQGIITLTETKNNERRDIPMDQTVKATLKALEALERESPFVFCNEEGRNFEDIGRSFETALRRSGIEDFRFHDLRHTFASNLVMEGVDIMTVKELMGHKTLEMTLRYSHLAPNHKTRAINILDRVMSQNPPQSSTTQKVVALSR